MDKRFESVLRMKDGLGDSSYARNSTLQGNALECIEHDLEETIWRTAIHGCPTIRVADLGSSSGHNAVNAAKTIIKAFKNKVLSSHGSIPMPELQIFFNDLPSNDFNTLFNIISDDRSEENIVKGPGIFVGGIPGSFYRRLFPANSLHFFFSAFALQWLSQVPEGVTDKKCIAWNGGNVHVSNPEVAEVYSQQFQTDFAHFLSLRGPEVVSGGRMFLIFAARESIDPTQQGRGEIIAKLIQLAFSDIILQVLKSAMAFATLSMSSVSVSGSLAPICETCPSRTGLQPSTIRFPTKKVFKTFSGLKDGVETSFFSHDRNAVLWFLLSDQGQQKTVRLFRALIRFGHQNLRLILLESQEGLANLSHC